MLVDMNGYPIKPTVKDLAPKEVFTEEIGRAHV